MSESNEDLLLKNVADLRKKLIRTEHNLQLLQTPSHDLHHRYGTDDIIDPEGQLRPLTLDDLTPEHLTSSMSSLRSSTSSYTRSSKRMSMMTSPGLDGKGSHQHVKVFRWFTSVLREPAMSSSALRETSENRHLRKKLQALREGNTRLVTENHSLQNDLETCQYDLRMTKAQLRMLKVETEAGKTSMASLEDKCSALRTELKANDAALRLAEQSLEESGRQLTERDSLVHRHQREVRKLRAELAEEQKLKLRLEEQRDIVVKEVEELNEKLDNFKLQTQKQLTKLSATEEHLRGSLAHCDKEREELLARATSLEEDLQDAKDHVRTLLESNSSLQGAEASMKAFRQETDQQGKKIQELEAEIRMKEQENQDLRELTDRQSERLAECQRDLELGREEMQRLERELGRRGPREVEQNARDVKRSDEAGSTPPSSLSKELGVDSGFEHETYSVVNHSQTVISELRLQLAVKDAELQHVKSSANLPLPQSSLSSLPELGSSRSPTSLRAQLAALMEKSKLEEKKTQELEKVILRLESKAGKQSSDINHLQRKLAKAEAGRASAESRMSLRDGQLAQLHAEVQGRANEVAVLEKELKKCKGQVSALESQLSEKTSAFSSHVAKLQELQAEVEAKSSQLTSAKEELKSREQIEEGYAAKLAEMRKLNSEQCHELQQQLEMLQQKTEAQTTDLHTLREVKKQAERDVSQKEERLQRLQDDLSESQKEVIKKNVENQQLWNTLQNRADEGSLRLSQMEAALVVCKQELAMYIDQLEGEKKKHDQEIELKNKEVADLEERWGKASAEMEERGLRSSELEQALRERQEMLQQSTERIAELEDREAQLEQQVSGLTKELGQLRVTAAREGDSLEKKLHQARLEVEDRTQQLREAKEILSTAQTDLSQARVTSKDLEEKLREARQDGENQGEKTAQLETELNSAKAKLEDMLGNAKEVDEVLERTREESRQSKERCRHLDDELHQAQEDLREAATQLGELHRLLQRSKADNKLKEERMQELNDSLRQSQEEVRCKERDMAEMDLALRTSQRELLQRSAQVSQLDVTVKERQSEMEREILQLQTSLNKCQYQLKQSKQRITELEEKEGKLREDSQSSEVRLHDLKQTIQKQDGELALKSKTVTRLEQRVEELMSDLKAQKEECIEKGQHLRLGREQAQQTQVSLAEIQRQLAEAHRQQDNLSSELEEALAASRAKDSELAHLAEDLGAARAQEMALQTQYTSELQQIARLRDEEVELKEDEVAQLQESHAKLLASRDQLDSSARLQISQLKAAKQGAREELSEALKKVDELEADLAASREVINATNEAIVIKESEVARLKAKVSGYERAMFGIHFNSGAPSRASPQRPSSADFMFESSPSSGIHRGSLEHRLSSPASHGMNGSLELRPSVEESAAPTKLTDKLIHTQSGAETSVEERLVTHFSQAEFQEFKGDRVSLEQHSDFPSSDKVKLSYHQTETKFHSKVDKFSDVTDTDSIISGVERLPEMQPQEQPGTFQAMLDFVNQQILSENGGGTTVDDTSWLNPDDMSDGGLLLTPTHSSRASSLSPPTPLKSANSSPSSRSAPPTPGSPRRKSGIPLRKGSSPGRRVLHFSKGGTGHSVLASFRGGNQVTRNGRQAKSPDKRAGNGNSSPETTPLKQKLANEKARLKSQGKAKLGGSTQLKPKQCIASLQAQLQANDARKLKLNEALFGDLEGGDRDP
ncbi:uncharacterized protein [Diadema setosum]|uniref:uncharacterized protein n=1 Tax=Diadema setosum TaxID=31175 RepID=UPI003B3AF995